MSQFAISDDELAKSNDEISSNRLKLLMKGC